MMKFQLRAFLLIVLLLLPYSEGPESDDWPTYYMVSTTCNLGAIANRIIGVYRKVRPKHNGKPVYRKKFGSGGSQTVWLIFQEQHWCFTDNYLGRIGLWAHHRVPNTKEPSDEGRWGYFYNRAWKYDCKYIRIISERMKHIPDCSTETDAMKDMLVEECYCDEVVCPKNRYCLFGSCLTNVPDCNSNGFKNTYICICKGTTLCTKDKYCLDGPCLEKLPDCNTDGKKITGICLCNRIRCEGDVYCRDDKCIAIPNCKSDSLTEKTTTKCNCKGITCPKDKYCFEAQCIKKLPKCSTDGSRVITLCYCGGKHCSVGKYCSSGHCLERAIQCQDDGSKIDTKCLCDGIGCPVNYYCLDGDCYIKLPKCNYNRSNITKVCNCNTTKCDVGRFCIYDICRESGIDVWVDSSGEKVGLSKTGSAFLKIYLSIYILYNLFCV